MDEDCFGCQVGEMCVCVCVCVALSFNSVSMLWDSSPLPNSTGAETALA